MACYITYGPISLENVIIKMIRCETVMGEDGITERYKKWTISFAAHCGSNYNPNSFTPGGNIDRGLTQIPSDSAYAISWKLTQPRQYFKMQWNDKIFLESPQQSFHTMDSNFGPFCRNVQVTNVAGEMGSIATNGGGSYFLVSGTFEVCHDGRSQSAGQETTYIQGYSMGCDHDVDGDSMLTTMMTTIHIYGRPEAIRSLAGRDGIDSVDGHFGELGIILSNVLEGFKRKRAKVQVKPGATEAVVMLIDEEMMLPLGSLSPATFFEPSDTEYFRIGSGAGTEAAPACIKVITIKAIAPKNDTRERVIRQMMYWIAIKSQAGLLGRGSRTGGDGYLKFSFYREVTVAIDYKNNAITMTAKCEMKVPIGGLGAIPYNPAISRTTAATDYPDVDKAMLARAPGEPLQGTQRMRALSPTLNYYGTKGDILGNILTDRIKLSISNASRQQPDGKDLYCPPTISSGGEDAALDGMAFGPAGETAIVTMEVTDYFGIANLALGWINTDIINYESVWMQTKYDTDKGSMVLPTGGVMPGGTGDPVVQDRVEIALHKGLTRKTVKWGIRCVSETQPNYPATDTGDSNDILVRAVPQPAACVPVGPNLWAWTITGTYYYDCLTLKQPGDKLSVGLLPITPGMESDYAFPPAKAVPGYLPST